MWPQDVKALDVIVHRGQALNDYLTLCFSSITAFQHYEFVNVCNSFNQMEWHPIKMARTKFDFIPRPTGGVLAPHPFFLISAKLMELRTQNLQHLLCHQFYIPCANKNFLPTIGWPQMTSGWRHVRAILMQNKGLRESLCWTQFFKLHPISLHEMT